MRAVWCIVVVVAGAGHCHCRHWDHQVVVIVMVNDVVGGRHVDAGGGVVVAIVIA